MRHLLGVIAMAITLVVAPAAYAGPYSAVYVFGDSLTDAGNNAIALDSQGIPRTATPIPNQAFIPTATYASGRYSNGPVWAEYFAAALGVPLAPSLAGGTDFSYGGATTGVTPPGGFPPPLLAQVAGFIALPGAAPSSALYIIAGGGNDARSVLGGAADAATTIANYGVNMKNMITSLYAEGARNFLVVNTPDLGLTPALQLANLLTPGAAAAASGLASAMNASLAAQLATLSAAIAGGVDLLDSYALVGSIVANPSLFGLTNATAACATSAACIANPGTTFFWDGIHPTTAGAQVVARAALAAVPEPGTIALLLALVIAARAFRPSRRRGLV